MYFLATLSQTHLVTLVTANLQDSKLLQVSEYGPRIQSNDFWVYSYNASVVVCKSFVSDSKNIVLFLKRTRLLVAL
jgi:hypothetical protein